MSSFNKISVFEKIGYALGDGAANIAWRGVATFLFIFYTDVFGLDPAAVGILLLVARFSDGVSDVVMGVIGDRTKSKYGHFRPWVLWTAIPLGVSLSLLFTTPPFGYTGKIIYAYFTYILFTLVYTANNIPYGALMAVITPDNKERTSFGSYRMVGAFAGGMIVQGALLLLVAWFGNVEPQINMHKNQNQSYEIQVKATRDVENVNISTSKGVALFTWKNPDKLQNDNKSSASKSFAMQQGDVYEFSVAGQPDLAVADIRLIDQRNGYSNSIYLLSAFLALFMFITFLSTKERVEPPLDQQTNLKTDLKDLITNRPWIVLLIAGLMFNIYNNIKQGIVVLYFSHYIHQQLMAGTYLVALMLASIAGAMVTAPLGKLLGKKTLFIAAFVFSAGFNAMLYFIDADNLPAIFTLGVLSEFGAAILPTLFFAMLGDVADYAEYHNNRRATGLVYSAGSFATKLGGGIAGAIIGFLLTSVGYNGLSQIHSAETINGIKDLMSWVPALIALPTIIIMLAYPLNSNKLDLITDELIQRRNQSNNKK